MGVFSKLFGGDETDALSGSDRRLNFGDTDAKVMVSAAAVLRRSAHPHTATGVSESISATITGGFLTAKRALSGIVHPAAVARTSSGEALWIPLPDMEPETREEPKADLEASPDGEFAHEPNTGTVERSPLDHDDDVRALAEASAQAAPRSDAPADTLYRATLLRPSRRPPPLPPPSRSRRRTQEVADLQDAQAITTTLTMPVLDAFGVTHAPESQVAKAYVTVESFHDHDNDGATGSTLAELVDAAVDALFDESGYSAAVDTVTEHAADRSAVLETFAGVARVHGRPLRELMFQLSVGSTARSWASACRPLLCPLLDAAEQIDCVELAAALRQLDAALELAVSGTGSEEPIDAAASEGIQLAYEQLRQQMPEVFSASNVIDNRRLMLFETLLLQVPAMHRRTIAKLYAAGLSTIGQLTQASPDELTVVVNGLDRDLATAIIEHLQRFERERSRVDPTTMRGHIHGRMRTTVGRLGQLQVEFERAESEGSQERKKAVRRARESAVLELQRLLAEIGNLALIEELRRCSTRGKIRRVQTYLETQVPA
jgi:hypothetical protein